jgi:hypothetical protein
VLVTKNVGQLSDPDECDSLKRSGLHHVTYEQRGERLEGLGRALGAIIAAMPSVMRTLQEAGGQRLVGIMSVQGTRFEMTDPVEQPPPYWPH